MRPQSRHRRIRDILDRIRRLFRREPDSPDDPYALVGAPKKPRPPYRRAAAAEPLE
jgi:alkanesulfonate monooxygenase SsuD/methylene tetrahydromethanopterin reductase-like flavin-dependent oxidoreductase (luciferase family)